MSSERYEYVMAIARRTKFHQGSQAFVYQSAIFDAVHQPFGGRAGRAPVQPNQLSGDFDTGRNFLSKQYAQNLCRRTAALQ